MEIIEDKYVTTRVPHNCWGCKREFRKGINMRFLKNVGSGTVLNIYLCEDCDIFISGLDPDEREGDFEYGDLLNYDDYREKIESYIIGEK